MRPSLHWKGLLFIARASRLYRPRPRARPRGHGELLKLSGCCLGCVWLQCRKALGGSHSSAVSNRSRPQGPVVGPLHSPSLRSWAVTSPQVHLVHIVSVLPLPCICPAPSTLGVQWQCWALGRQRDCMQLWGNPFCNVFVWLCVSIFVSMCMYLHACAGLSRCLSTTYPQSRIPATALL